MLDKIVTEVLEHTWRGADGILRRETDYLVDVVGDLDRPRLERDKHPHCRWIGPDELDLLLANRLPEDRVLRVVVEAALTLGR